MRNVLVYKLDYDNRDEKFRPTKVPVGSGKFHQFGVDYEELNDGVGNFSTAIVEMPDGKVVNVPVDLIEFIEV